MSVTFTCGGEKEANFANTNARALLVMLEMENDCDSGGLDLTGEVLHEDFPELFRKIIRAKNMVYVRSPHIRETVTEGRVTYCGTTDEVIRRRLDMLEEVLLEGSQSGHDLNWA